MWQDYDVATLPLTVVSSMAWFTLTSQMEMPKQLEPCS